MFLKVSFLLNMSFFFAILLIYMFQSKQVHQIDLMNIRIVNSCHSSAITLLNKSKSLAVNIAEKSHFTLSLLSEFKCFAS